MDFSLSEEQTLLRDEIRRFARQELSPGAGERDAAHEFPHDLWLKCGEIGLHGLPVPAEWGGAGLDPLSTVIALEALGYGCEDGGLAFSVCAHLLACVVPIWKHGTEDQKKRYLPLLCSGKLIAVNAMTEADSGSDAFAMRTSARREGDDFVLNGTKTFSSNGPIADLAVVYAQTDPAKGYLGGFTGFLVEWGTEGFSRGQTFEKLGLRTCPIGELVFQDVRLPPSAVLGPIGAGGRLFNQSMEWERICLAGLHIGTMERLLDQAIEYARSRKASGRPISQFQAVSHRIVDMKVRLEAARLLTYRAALRLDTSSTVGLDASMTKLFISESLLANALGTVRVLGGYGIMADYGVERVLRDSVASTIYSGTNDIQRNIIASWLGL